MTKLTKQQAVRELQRRGWTNVHNERPRSISTWATPPQGGRPVLLDPRDLLAELDREQK